MNTNYSRVEEQYRFVYLQNTWNRDAVRRMLEPDYDFVRALLWGGLVITVSILGAMWLR